MPSFSEFRSHTAIAAKEAIKLYFQPLVTLVNIVFASNGSRPNLVEALRQIFFGGIEAEQTSARRPERSR